MWLQEGMTCSVSLFEGNPIAIELPARVTFEIVEADPVVKGQTASSSYKPAKLCERRAHHGAASYRLGHARHHHDGGRLLRRARQGLIGYDFAFKVRLADGPRTAPRPGNPVSGRGPSICLELGDAARSASSVLPGGRAMTAGTIVSALSTTVKFTSRPLRMN